MMRLFPLIYGMLVYLLLALFTLIGSSSAFSQQSKGDLSSLPMDLSEKVPVYYLALFFDYEEGKADEVINFIREHFLPADKKAGRQVMVFTPLTGPWDEMAFFPLAEKPTVPLEQISPADEKWNAALLELAGSQEKVDALWKEFEDYVVKSSSTLVKIPEGWRYQLTEVEN